ncbi:serine/threonine-protein kinase B-raf-like [Iris pallida]|uniref:Serine/threonine-protein kinase B-raf-like n=1 Tax=Iris pallida TaxID=29817 RepID=A0AAX6GR96_IRIPA|nr:serine/threonine-protein kinase B-raf-like [Iris pallida]
MAAAETAEPRRNVKLLCSFGGRILPRPSDGALRYAGGHTRILSVPRDLPFPDLMSRLADARGGVGPTVVKYQLPNEDLDALISVSCPEDLDNMMEEYEKLAESSAADGGAAGAARLRVFLFTPAELSSADSISPVGTEQRYFDAVNGIVDGAAGSSTGSLGRKDSGVSSNSDCEGVSSETFLSPDQVQFFNAQPLNLHPLPLKPAQPSPTEENSYGGVNYRAAAPPLSQLPPLPHTHPQQLGPQNSGPRFQDCYMCQKTLPHAHSDPTAQDFFNVSSAAASRPLYSQWSEDAVRLRSHNLVDSVVEPKVESTLHPVTRQFPQVPASWYENDSPFPQKIENPSSIGLALDDAQSSYGKLLGNFPPQNVGYPHYPVQQHREGAGATYDYAKPVSGMMEGLRLNPTEVKGFSGQGKPVGMPDSSPSAVERYYGYIPQVGDSVTVPGRGYVKVPEGTYVRHIDQLPLGNPDLSRVHNLQHVESGQPMAMGGQFPHHLVNMEPPIPSESLLGMPTYAGSNHPAYSERSISTTLGDLRAETYQIYPHDTISHLTSPQGSDLSNGTSLSGLGDPFQEPASSESLFCNQDPRTVVGGTTALPPRPKRVASKESILPKDYGVQVHLGNSTESDIIALLEEGGLHPSSDSLEKALNPGSTQRVKGYGDEQVKQDLQAVAEGVASAVLNTSSPPGPSQDGGKIAENNAERTLTSVHQKLEDNKTRESEKINPTFQITDDLGRLQMIQNSDLEELRELGSGTFGTVYHGKWRGTDVAIKRINERCFAGKPSEKERMRADFWNEASNLADLHHPNVVAFYGVVLDGPGGSVATVTEYMVNGSLRNALQRTLDRRKRLVIAMDVAFGMEYLHKKNIVHFDLKSDNLLVNLRDPQRPICKVGDLGLSKVKCQTLISGGVRGTLPWMAPELLNGSSNLVTEKVDVFSFGIVMWELLTGEEPYADLHYGAIIGGIVSNTLRPPVPESCEPQWRSLMEKCWSADPSERPSFTEVADRLRSIAASIPRGQVQGQAHK